MMSQKESCVLGGTYKDCVKVFACSDLHEFDIEELDPSGADVAILAGDIHECPRGRGDKIRKDDEIKEQVRWVEQHFLPWCGKYPQTQFVVVAGNNDKFVRDPSNPLLRLPDDSNVHYLQDSGIVLKGLKIWGSPWVKDHDLRDALERMPDDVEILVTHQTPAIKGSYIAGKPEKNMGSKELASVIKNKQPKVCVCGHVHAKEHHPAYIGDTVVMNVALKHKEDFYRPREFIMARNALGGRACIVDIADNMWAESYRQIQVKGKKEKTMSKVKIVRGDITEFRGDAIVNAANELMLGGGGVDRAIHRAAGPELLAECRKVAEVRPGVRCPTGEARITPGGRLIAKWVIHTVGPDCRGGMFAEAPELLANCYRNSLSLAAENGIRKIAFPSISTGVFDFPKDEAAKIAIGVIKDFLETHPDVEVFFFGRPDTMEYYEKEAKRQGLR